MKGIIFSKKIKKRIESRRFVNNAGYDLLSQTPTVQINNESQPNSYMNNSIANKYMSHYSRNEDINPETFTIKNRKKKKRKIQSNMKVNILKV